MPQVPTRRDLGQVRVHGNANPADINPKVALDIGHAGAAYKHAFDTIGAAFSGLGEKQQAMDDANWLAESKIASLTADDNIRRDTELNAGADGTGFEQAPLRLDQSMKEIEAKPGGSVDARAKFKLWSAERHFETGRWAANTAQKRLQDYTGDQLDRRLDVLTNLSSNNPDQANEYFKAYEDEVNSRVGSAINAQEAATRTEQARTNILKSATITKAIKNPSDFGKAILSIQNGQHAFENENPETRGNQTVMGDRLNVRNPASVSFELETGKKDPLQGVRNVSKDAGGSKSYGNFGINSGGSAQQFAAQYGAQFGLTAKPGTKEFDAQWKNAAGADPVALHAAELEWWDKTIGSKVSNNLVRAGVSSDIASDPRVVAYFADRSVQQGPGSIANHADRIQGAFKASKGDVGTFLSEMGRGDRKNVKSDFRTAMGDGTYSERGNETRLAGRERLSMQAGTAAAPVPRTEAERSRFDSSKIPPIPGGTIQPQELLSLSPKDYHAVVTQMAPYLVEDTTKRMEKAMSSLAAKGTQSVITPEEIDNLAPIVGAKTSAAWKDALRDGQEQFVITTEVKNLTPEQRYAKLSQIVPQDSGLATAPVENLHEADTALKLTPQEHALYERHLNNLTGPGGVDNKDGSRSTLFQTTVEADGKFYTIPTVYDGKILPPKEAVDRAFKEGINKFPSYNSEAEAESRYQQLHSYMEKDTSAYLKNRGTDLEDQTRRFEMYSRSIRAVNEAIKKDPYAYFTVENESGRQAAKMLANAPRGEEGTPQREQAFDTLIKLQKQEGLASDEIKILAPSQAKGMANVLKDAKTGPAAEQVTDGWRQTYGKHFGQLWGELVENGLSNDYLAMRTASRAGQDALVRSHALEKAMDEGGAKGGRKGMLVERAGIKPIELSKAISDEMNAFSQTLQYKTGSARGMEAYRSAIERVTSTYVIEGKQLSDAARQAAKDIFLENNKVIGAVAVPTKVYEQYGGKLNRSLGDISHMIEPFESMIVAPVKSSGGATPPGYEHGRYMNNIVSNGKFVTNETSTGVYLLDHVGEIVMADSPEGLRPLEWSWETLNKQQPGNPWYFKPGIDPNSFDFLIGR